MRPSHLVSLALGIALLILVAFTGNADVIDPLNIQDNVAVPAGELSGSNTIGQTFVFHFPCLDAIQVRGVVLHSLPSTQDRIVLHLRRAKDSPDIAVASFPLSEFHNNDFIKFTFPPIQDSQDQTFYFLIDASEALFSPGAISLWASSEDDYPDGAMYLNGSETDRDLAFRAYYQPDGPLLIQSSVQVIEKYSPLLVFILVFMFVPGSLFLWFAGWQSRFDLIEMIALAGGVSLAFISAVAFFALVLGIPVSGFVGVLGLPILLSGVVFFRRSRTPSAETSHHASQFVSRLLGLFALISTITGLLQIQNLPVPLWVDSPTHATYIQAIVEQGHLPLTTLYHLGYDSIAAVIAQMSGFSIPAVMLVFGQLLITQTGLGMFLFVKRLSGSAVAGLASAVCVWFLSPTPTYFMTWGRYSLLCGVAILPIALLLVMEWLEQSRVNMPTISLAIISCVGMTFAHIRLIAFYLVFVAIYLTWRMWSNASRRQMAVRAGLVVVAAFVFGIFWLGALLANNVSWQQILTQNSGATMIDSGTAFAVASVNHGMLVGALAVMGLIIALIRRSQGALTVLVWFVVLCAISMLPANINGEAFAPSFVILLTFVPSAFLNGELADWIYTRLASQSANRFVLGGALIAVSILGARDMLSIVNPSTILFSAADEQAMTWIDKHTSVDAKFLVDSFDWFNGSYVPVNGGTWIPVLTHRSIDFLGSSSLPSPSDAKAIARWLDERQVAYIYLGWRSGILTKKDFACRPDLYTPLYDQAGIAIFAVPSRVPETQSPIRLTVECP